jgi:uncharacterized protein
MDGAEQRPETLVTRSSGERELQREYGTEERASRFYAGQMLDHLNQRMQEFVGRQEMLFISTAAADGDVTRRSGPARQASSWSSTSGPWPTPEYRGNGVLASLGNIVENRTSAY